MAAGGKPAYSRGHRAGGNIARGKGDGAHRSRIRSIVHIDNIACDRACGNLHIKAQGRQVGLVVGVGGTGVGGTLQVHGRACRIGVGGEVPVGGIGNARIQVPGYITDHALPYLHMVVRARHKRRGRGDRKHIAADRDLARRERYHQVAEVSVIEDGDAAKATQHNRLVKGDRDRAWRAHGGIISRRGRRGQRRCRVNREQDRGRAWAGVPRRVGLRGHNAVGTIRQRRAGGVGPVAVGIRHHRYRGPGTIHIKVDDGTRLGGAVQSRRIVLGLAIARGTRVRGRVQGHAGGRRCQVVNRHGKDRCRGALASNIRQRRGVRVHPVGQVRQVEWRRASGNHAGSHRHRAHQRQAVIQLDHIPHLRAGTKADFQVDRCQLGDVVGGASARVACSHQVHTGRQAQRGEVPIGGVGEAGVGVARGVRQGRTVHDHIVTRAVIQRRRRGQRHLAARHHHTRTRRNIEGLHRAVVGGLLDGNGARYTLRHGLVEGHHQRAGWNQVGGVVRGAQRGQGGNRAVNHHRRGKAATERTRVASRVHQTELHIRIGSIRKGVRGDRCTVGRDIAWGQRVGADQSGAVIQFHHVASHRTRSRQRDREGGRGIVGHIIRAGSTRVARCGQVGQAARRTGGRRVDHQLR